RHLPVVLGHLEAELAERAEELRAGGTVLAGVEKVLERLHRREDVVQSVLTGNTRANAALKLGVFGLDRWVDLEIGAFGSDDADRRRLVPIAVRRAEQKTGLTFTPDQVWVIGDTPNDLACATAAGARCVLVGTGHVPIEALRDIGADAVLEDLTDVDALVELLAG
ncbi:MAG: hypothetical protein QOG64_3253, partial [Acidimicrobiaceae bacterium]|nr:hypothetical protein [Acidimicrobiaceae bacterium]